MELEPGESREIRFELDDRSFSVWENGWKVPEGTYQVMIGASSQDIRQQTKINVSGEQMAAAKWQKENWYETLRGEPKREEWEMLMGHPVPVLQEAKKGQFTMDSSCLEMKDSSFAMKVQYKVTEHIIAKSFDGKKDMNDPAYRMTITCATDCPLRTIIISGGGIMSDSLAKGLLLMANGHWLKGLAAMLKK